MASSDDDSFINSDDGRDLDNNSDSNCDESGSEGDNEADNEQPVLYTTHVGHKKIVDLTVDDILGLKFSRQEEAYKFYSAYAKLHGFVVRKDIRRRDENGDFIVQQYVCNKEGLRNKKHLMRVDRKMDHRPLTRTGCHAKLRVRFDYKISCWKVVSFKEGHNHELYPASAVPLIPAYRAISDADKAQVDSLNSQGVKTCHIMGYLLAQKGGYAGVGFLKEDLYNYFHRQKRDKIKDGDARISLTYLQGKADNDGMFFSRYTTTDDCRLQNLFWADSTSITDFQCFGDVLAFDTTYNKNKYNLPLVIFSGCNHHSQTVIFGCGLLINETAETYKWVLETFLAAMRNKHPRAVVTDGDSAMRKAIKQVFPNATHRLCAWHLHRNAKGKTMNDSFVDDFEKALYHNMGIDEFEEFWKQMVAKHGLEGNEWVRKTYEKKSMWANAYLRDQFFAGIRTTSRCEGINSYIKSYVERKNSVVELLHSMEEALRGYRHNELVADFNSLFTEPVMTTSLHMYEREASKIFTLEIFREVKFEIEEVGALMIMERIENGDSVMFKMSKLFQPNRIIGVVYDTVNSSFSCDCRLFQSRGIPCSHVFCAMKREHMKSIPSSLICKRWTKSVKSEFFSSDQLDEMDPDVTKITRRGAAAAACNRLCEIASKNGKYFDEIRDEILKLTSKYDNKKGSSRTQGDNFNDIRDPTTVPTKGGRPSKKRYSRTRRRCTNCRKTGHTLRTCPKRIGTKDEHIAHDASSPHEDNEMRRQDNEDNTTFNDDNVQHNDHSTQYSNYAENDKEGTTLNECNIKHKDTEPSSKKGKERKEKKVKRSTQNSINDSGKQPTLSAQRPHLEAYKVQQTGLTTHHTGKQPISSAQKPHSETHKVQHTGHTIHHIGKQTIDFSNKGNPEITHRVLVAPPPPPGNVAFAYGTSNSHLTSSNDYGTSSIPHNIPSGYGALIQGMPMPPLPSSYGALSHEMPMPPFHGAGPSRPQFPKFLAAIHMSQYMGGVQNLHGGTNLSHLLQKEVKKKKIGTSNKDEADSSKEQQNMNKPDGDK
ncbi:protein FAR1-RELATED SEQUENCE 5-like isoform X2 [Lotus japonicus]|uniref:protein FAR1-RELATED SEQUENCE 5-like isoform X2 n=1 Tax=Lotus japonicus TaxID=34305 RepID=UPI00258DB80B|nr:protein FAR1-RELATED SEQUENCE 5-like isoform X2 [Lotus japonicus]